VRIPLPDEALLSNVRALWTYAHPLHSGSYSKYWPRPPNRTKTGEP